MSKEQVTKEFTAELKDLLARHRAYISFDCSSSSDTHGICEAAITVRTPSGEIIRVDGWDLMSSDL